MFERRKSPNLVWFRDFVCEWVLKTLCAVQIPTSVSLLLVFDSDSFAFCFIVFFFFFFLNFVNQVVAVSSWSVFCSLGALDR